MIKKFKKLYLPFLGKNSRMLELVDLKIIILELLSTTEQNRYQKCLKDYYYNKFR